MTFAQIQGNEKVKQALVSMVDSGRIPHAIMFDEPDGGGAVALALAFLQYLYCQGRHGGDSCSQCPSCNKISKLIHPDIHFVFPVTGGTALSFIKNWRELVTANPFFTEAELGEALGIEGKSSLISVADASELLQALSLSALEGGYRAVLIYLPEKMNQTAANKLLKAIEEPPEKTQFLLVTHAPEKVMPTIVSRCQNIRVQPFVRTTGVSENVLEELSQYGEMLRDLMDALLSRSLSGALDAGERISALPSRESAKAFCKFTAEKMREVFLIQQGLGTMVRADADVSRWAASCRKTFPRTAMSALDRARMLVDRNVNQKIIFTDLVDRLYLQI